MDSGLYKDCGDNRGEIVFPWVRGRILAESPHRVLDFGCGDARFAEQLAEGSGVEVWGYDIDSEMRRLARERMIRKPELGLRLLDRLEDLPEQYFDAAFLLGVWMCWSSWEECVDLLQRLARSLKSGGVLIASVTHPCFRDQEFATYRTNFSMDNYLNEGSPFRVTIGRDGNELCITDFHWSLTAMFEQARQAGLSVLEIQEHADEPGYSLPPWLSLVCKSRVDHTPCIQ